MSKYKNFNDDSFDLINDYDNPSVDAASEIETNILIREEAQFLAKSLANEFRFDQEEEMDNNYFSESDRQAIEDINANLDTNNYLLAKIDKKLKKYSGENKKVSYTNIFDVNLDNDDDKKDNHHDLSYNSNHDIEDIKQTLIKNNDNLERTFKSFENFMNSALEKMDSILNKKPVENAVTEDNIEVFDNNDVIPFNETEFFEENNSPMFYENDNNDNIEVSQLQWDNNSSTNSEGFDYQIKNNNIANISELKDKQFEFNNKQDLLNNQIDILKNNISNLTELETNNYHSLNNKYSNEINEIHNQLNDFQVKYELLNKEINNIYNIWTDNNNLLLNLESLLNQLNSKNDELIDERNEYLSLLHDKTISNEKYINDILEQNENIKKQFDEFTAKVSDQSVLKAEILEEVDNKIATSSNELKDLMQKEIEGVKSEISTITAQTVEEELAKRNLLSLEAILNKERIIDDVLNSHVFNLALKNKVEESIEADLTIKDIKDVFGNFSIESYRKNMIDDIVESDRIRNIVSIESNSLFNQHKVDIIEKLNSTKEYIYQKNFELSERMMDLESKMDSMGVNEKEIFDMISSSNELETIINDKLIFIINEKINSIQENISFINTKLQDDLKDYVDNNLKNNVIDELVNSDKVKFIKNEALQSIYSELLKRDEKLDLHSEEIVKNYQALLENNRVLENLEKLLLKQVEQVEGFNKDKEDSIELIIEKITDQKANITELQEKIKEVMENVDGLNLTSQSKQKINDIDYDVYDNIKLMTLNLVKEEIKKVNLVGNDDHENYSTQKLEAKKQEEESDFFKNRISDILSKLNEDYEPLDYKNDLVDLNISVDDLNNNIEEKVDENFDWFYEKELDDYKKNKASNEDGLIDFEVEETDKNK